MSSALLKKPLPYLALSFAHIIWGMTFVASKIALAEFPVMSLAFLRFALASLLLAPFFLTETRKNIKLEHFPKLLIVGLSMITFNIAFFYEGLNRTTSIDASVLTLIIPSISLIAGWWFLKEKIYWINLIGVLTGLLGTVVIVGLPLFLVGSLSPRALFGNLLIILSDISFVIGAILSKRLLRTYSSLFLTGFVFLIGVISFAIPALNEYLANPTWVSKVTVLGLLGLLFIVLLSSISAYFLYNFALQKIDVIQVNLFQYLEPAVAASLAVPILGERISYSFIVGTVLIVLGVYWGTLGKGEHHHVLHKHHRI